MRAKINLYLFLLATAMFLTGCEKHRLDHQLKELCAKDGGMKAYEIVVLPQDSFSQWGQINFYRPTQKENALGEGYRFENEILFFKRGDPEAWRTKIRIFRKSDNRLLGESITYSRRGGDIPGPWHPSSFRCPEDSGDVPLLSKVFKANLKN